MERYTVSRIIKHISRSKTVPRYGERKLVVTKSARSLYSLLSMNVSNDVDPFLLQH